MSTDVLYHGNTLGIMGIDRNGKKLIMAAKEAGLNVGVYLDHAEPENTKLADFTVIGNYRDKEKLTEFGENCDAVIYETAAIDSIVIKYLSKY
ncbi:MAG: phosphoribosylaminoimidazole carboxylase, partial [Candidatus Limosilactobacillus intestinavium]